MSLLRLLDPAEWPEGLAGRLPPLPRPVAPLGHTWTFNSRRLRAHAPGVQAATLTRVPEGLIDRRLRVLIRLLTSQTNGCRYCATHSLLAVATYGVDAAKVESLWSFETSDAFTEAERVALAFVLRLTTAWNDLDDGDFERLRRHWSDTEIVEIAKESIVMGFSNRLHDGFQLDVDGPLQPISGIALDRQVSYDDLRERLSAAVPRDFRPADEPPREAPPARALGGARPGLRAVAGDGELELLAAPVTTRLGFVPNYLRLLAWSPSSMAYIANVAAAAWYDGELSPEARVLARLAAARQLECAYLDAQAMAEARRVGMSAERAAAPGPMEPSAAHTPAEQELIRFVRLFATNWTKIEERHVDAMRVFWTEREILEAAFNCQVSYVIAQLADGFGLAPEPELSGNAGEFAGARAG